MSMYRERIIGYVECCRVWPIVWADNGYVYDWHRCGICGEKPPLIEIGGEDIEWFDSSTA